MYKNKSFTTKKKAFTLIELLIVIAIIGILFIVLVSKVDFATDKAKATGVQTDFRSFQLAFDTVAKENAGFNTFGWDTGDANQDGIRNSYDEGDNGAGGGIAQNGIQDGTEVFTGHKVYAETFTKVYSLKKNGIGNYDRDALNRLETAINANLDPKLHITIKDDGEIVMANGARDPWNKEYHGYYISNAETDGKDRGAIVIYSDGANNEFGSEHKIANGVVTVSIPGSNKAGKDDYSIVSLYTYLNGYGEVKNVTTGFSNNQVMSENNNESGNNGGGSPDTPVMPDTPDTPQQPEQIDYEVIDGANETFTKNETTLEFRSNADYDKFVEVKIDGNVIDESNYTVTEGSTVVTFTKAFFDSLGEGEHTVEIISEDGSAQALFDIAKSTIPVENPSGTIDSYSWSEIQYLARLNLSKEEYKSKYGIKVGDYKEVNGVKYVLVDLDGNTYDGFVFMYNTGTTKAMNGSYTNKCGYASTKVMKAYVDDGDDTNNVDLYDNLDVDLKAVIKKVTVTCNSGKVNPYNTDDPGLPTYTHECHLFLASSQEVGVGFLDYYYSSEGSMFDYFWTKQTARANFATLTNISHSWWLRSANSEDTYSFYTIDTSGDVIGGMATFNGVVVPTFVIG